MFAFELPVYIIIKYKYKIKLLSKIFHQNHHEKINKNIMNLCVDTNISSYDK